MLFGNLLTCTWLSVVHYMCISYKRGFLTQHKVLQDKRHPPAQRPQSVRKIEFLKHLSTKNHVTKLGAAFLSSHTLNEGERTKTKSLFKSLE